MNRSTIGLILCTMKEAKKRTGRELSPIGKHLQCGEYWNYTPDELFVRSMILKGWL
jgi:hypothetical protein